MSITPNQARQVLARADCLHDKLEISSALERMAKEVNDLLGDKNPLVLCLMTGGLITTSELLLRFNAPAELDYIHATRYGNDIQGNELKWIAKPKKSLKDRHIMIIDDILDEGQTLQQIVAWCKDQGAKAVYTCVLVEKEHDRKQGLTSADICGLSVPDRYVFGFGMDYKGYLRNLAGIYAAHKDDE